MKTIYFCMPCDILYRLDLPIMELSVRLVAVTEYLYMQ